MPIQPIPCAPGGGSGEPVEVTTCCSPSIASTALCRADGSTVLAVVRSGCVECGQTAENPTVVGWLDVAGTFTPGPLPADVGPCDAGCVDTVCRQLCDDTDGDGATDVTYSELWCIRGDGSAELVLTYRDDPSVPYVPVAPVDCTYGCPESETVQLCDARPDGTTVPFLRRYSFLQGTATFEDVALDGQTPHVVLGTITTCAGTSSSVCAEETTPVATLGLCLPDGRPLAVLVTRDCDGTVTQDGWLDLTTGTYTAGPPPTGAAACGDSRAFELAGVLCDVNATTGDVHGLVLVEYAYNADGSLDTVRLVDPATGATYALQGELRRCPSDTSGGGADTDLIVLCDTLPDGTVVSFVRDFRRDPVTQLVTGHTDYQLDGTPYAPSGTVGTCQQPTEGRDVEITPMCVLNANGSVVQQILAEVTYDTATGDRLGVNYVDPMTWGPVALPGGTHLGLCPGPEVPEVEPCGDTEVLQLCDVTYDPQAPIPTPAGDFTLTGNVVAANGGTTLWFAQANQPADGVAELTVSGLIPTVLYEFRFAAAWIGAGGADPVGNAAIYRLDVLDGATVLATRTRNVSNGSSVFPGGVLTEDMPPLAFLVPASGVVTVRFTDLTTGGGPNDRDLFVMPLEVRTAVLTVTRTPFLRRLTFDCDGGLTSTQDLALDGTTPYTVQGEAGHCASDGGTPATATPCDVQNVLEACRCDDTDGDGAADTDYVELLGVDCDGALTSLGTYLPDLSAPYTPVAPVPCEDTDEGADPATGVQARRLELTPGAVWDLAAYPLVQSVTAVAHAGTGTVTTADGASTLHATEAATWSVARDVDAALAGPLTIAATSGTVTITWTQGVTL
ncbi:hypothetical protein [Streptomyces chilikensis]|uniref:Uncharacterized protein n=1 Tax=Streptomyces chilikensis TaxID=1194079 RepID=A0ABV3EJE2_9ACTN